jgi:hypothetical protein
MNLASDDANQNMIKDFQEGEETLSQINFLLFEELTK